MSIRFPTRHSTRWRRRMLFRGLALLLGLLPFVVIELGLCVFGLGNRIGKAIPL